MRHFVGEMVSFLEVATCRGRMTAWTPEDLPTEMNTNFRSPVLGLTRIKVYVILPHFLSRNFRVSPTDYIVVGPRDAQLDIPPICPTYPWNGGPKMLKIISLLTCNHLAQLIINPSATTLDFPREDDQPTGPHYQFVEDFHCGHKGQNERENVNWAFIRFSYFLLWPPRRL